MEWCQKPQQIFDTNRPWAPDVDPTQQIHDGSGRLAGGGCFGYYERDARSAMREVYPGNSGHYLIGFRIAPTLP